MTRKPKAKGRAPVRAKSKAKTPGREPVIYPDSLRPPPMLPDAEAVLKMGLRLSEEEIRTIKAAMTLHTQSKQPKLTWIGWRQIALACAIGAEHAKKESDGRLDTPLYRRVMSDFLKGTGFIFLNKDDRAAAVRLLPRWDEIDEWRSSLPRNRQQALNNPREVWAAYVEHRRELGDPEAKPRPPTRKRKLVPSLLEQYEALLELVEAERERAERAERAEQYFAALAQEIATSAKIDDDALAAIRTKVRAAHEGEGEAESPSVS
jgi:hypothetical protein